MVTADLGIRRTRSAGKVDPWRSQAAGEVNSLSTLPLLLTRSRGEYLRVVGIHSDG